MVGALKYNHLMGGFISLDVCPINYGDKRLHLYRKMITCFKSVPTHGFTKREEVVELLRPKLPELSNLEMGFLVNNFVPDIDKKIGGKHWKWSINNDAIFNHLEHIQAFDYKETYSGKCAFIGASNSDYCNTNNEKHMASIRKYFPNASIQMIDGATHMLHIEKPLETTQAIVNALEHMP
ncbi:valacyclovir hydrolase [Reticulomyxa filosa]|uniref:Valacyclovir hydrolase n=1 Tax=Reticulomyxa filosa TaxID=46433 RepID=X6N3V7_RETFI|nr:valacyclovir hydrolase [Reticulomyxa filosa]|eukprot:ETO20598.1 valacyclovir hydrolase [Reticulomyxa filosa]